MKNAIVLCSGGIDSVTTAFYVKKRLKYDKILILFFNYDQKTLIAERKFSKKCAKDLNAKFYEIKLEFLGNLSGSLINKEGLIKELTKDDLKNTKEESEKYYVPCRNTIFLSTALALAESLLIKEKNNYDIFVGFKCEGDEPYPDTTKKFVDEMNRLKKISTNVSGKIEAPLIDKDKEDIIHLGYSLEVNFKNTFSCYISRSTKHCGKCLSCKLRQAGFYWANIPDPTIYSE